MTFPDENLEAAVREAIGKPQGPITVADLAGLTRLSAGWLGIRDLSRLEHCTSLTELDLSINQISGLSPLVTNSNSGGLGYGDIVRLYDNSLDRTPGSEDLADAETLEEDGVMVLY